MRDWLDKIDVKKVACKIRLKAVDVMEGIMPESLKGPDAEKIWARASKQAMDQYPGLKSKDPDRFYALVMTIYKSMCTKHACMPKAESRSRSMKEMIEDLQMESKGLVVPKGIKGWSLYEGESPEANKRNREAVKDLGSALKRAAGDVYRKISKEIDGYVEERVGKAIGVAMRRHVFPVMEKYADRGADDAEPRYVAVQSVIDMVKEFYGIDSFTGLGDYI